MTQFSRFGWMVALCIPLHVSAQGKPQPVQPAQESPSAVVKFSDDSLVRAQILSTELAIQTKYGKLVIPMQEIRRVEPGRRIPAEVTKRIEAAVNNLGSENFRVRESATAELLALKELAYASTLKATKNADPEIAKRAQEIVGKLRAALPEDRLKIRTLDIVHTDEFTISGTIETQVLKGSTLLFGDMQIRIAEVRSMRFQGSTNDAEITLEALQHAMTIPRWKDTQVDFTEGAAVQVAASGEIDVYPHGAEANMYICGPKGPVRWGADRGRPMPVPPGTLIGKIGETGKEFVIGDKWESTSTAAGRLYLRIIPSPWGDGSAGSYTVKIQGGVSER
jgi:hypothetical protein